MNLLGIHDAEGASWLASDPGWVVESYAIGCDPADLSGRDYRPLSNAGLGVIVRLNNGYYPAGTIPLPSDYANFAGRVGQFVRASPGCTRWIIGNEPNHSQERPQGQPIYPDEYAECYWRCWKSIHGMKDYEHHEVLVAAIAPWNIETGDWLQYFAEILTELDATTCDGFALHAYTHGSDPALITSRATMEKPYDARYFHFLAYQDFLLTVPKTMRHLPVYITETNQNDPWTDVNDGWIQAACMQIDGWNRTEERQKIHCLCCYRAQGDQWAMHDKPQRLADFAAALALGIQSPEIENSSEEIEDRPPDETLPPIFYPLPPLSWDPRLDARGTVLVRAQAQPGQNVWRVQEGRWFDEAESQGRHNCFVDVQDEDGQRTIGHNLLWGWPGTTTTKVAENKSDPWLEMQGYNGCAADFPMEHTAPTYFTAPEGLSDRVEGLGLGDLARPGMTIHTSYFFKWQLVVEPEIEPGPEPEPPQYQIVHPLPGSVITQHWGQPCPEYAPGIWGHDGVDLGGQAEGTPVACIAAGTVAYTGWDEGYGNYVRVFHLQLGCHSFYAHLAATHVSVGQTLQPGQPVGTLGSTGNSTGVHLHLEIRLAKDDGSYDESCAPMPKGRCDPETFCAMHGLKL